MDETIQSELNTAQQDYIYNKNKKTLALPLYKRVERQSVEPVKAASR